jgi:hypothetical protein
LDADDNDDDARCWTIGRRYANVFPLPVSLCTNKLLFVINVVTTVVSFVFRFIVAVADGNNDDDDDSGLFVAVGGGGVSSNDIIHRDCIIVGLTNLNRPCVDVIAYTNRGCNTPSLVNGQLFVVVLLC